MRTTCFFLLFLLNATAASAIGVCFEPSPNGINGTWDCQPVPELRTHSHVGYSVDGVPCVFDWIPPIVWSISSSDTDPNVVVGPLPVAPDLATLYLWVHHDHLWPEETGATAAEFNLVPDGSNLLLLSVEPLNGVINLSTAPETLQLVMPVCIGADNIQMFLVAQLNMLYLGPLPVERGSWGSVKALYR